jgi:hypothetical protein
VAYHKWSNFKVTINDYRAILNYHVAKSKFFNQMVEKKGNIFLAKYFEKSK